MDGHGFSILWGVSAVVMGVCFVVFRRGISRHARDQRMMRGLRVGPNTQSPTLMAVGGAVFIVAGIFVVIGVSTGLLG